MSKRAMRDILAGLGGLACGIFTPSIFGERWLLAWSILIIFSLMQAVVLAHVLPDEVEQ